MSTTTSCADGAQVSEDNDFLNRWTAHVYEAAAQFQKRRPRSRSRDIAEFIWEEARAAGLPSVSVHNIEKFICLIAATYNPGNERYIDGVTNEEEHCGMAKEGRRTIHHAWKGSLAELRRQSGMKIKDRQIQYLLEVFEKLGYIQKLTRAIKKGDDFKGKYLTFHPNFPKLIRTCDKVIAKRKRNRVPATPTRENEEQLLAEDKNCRMLLTYGYDDEVAAGELDPALFSSNSSPAENCGCNKVPSGRPNEVVESSPSGAASEERRASEKNENRGTRLTSGARPSGISNSVSEQPAAAPAEPTYGEGAESGVTPGAACSHPAGPAITSINPGCDYLGNPEESTYGDEGEAGVTPDDAKVAVRSSYDTSSCVRDPGALSTGFLDPQPGSGLVDLRDYYENAWTPEYLQERLVEVTEREATLMRIFAVSMVAAGVPASDPSEGVMMQSLLNLVRYGALTKRQIELVAQHLRGKFEAVNGDASRLAYGRTLRQVVMRWDDLLKKATQDFEFSQVIDVLETKEGGKLVVTGDTLASSWTTPMQWVQRNWSGIINETVNVLTQPAAYRSHGEDRAIYDESMVKMTDLMIAHGQVDSWARFTSSGFCNAELLEEILSDTPEVLTRFWIWAIEPLLYTDPMELGSSRYTIADRMLRKLQGHLDPRQPLGAYGQTFLKVSACYAPEWLPLMHRAAGGMETSVWTDMLRTKTLRTVIQSQSACVRDRVFDQVCRDNEVQELRRHALHAVCKRTGLQQEHTRVFVRDHRYMTRAEQRQMRESTDDLELQLRLFTQAEWQKFWEGHSKTRKLVEDLRSN